MIAPDVSVAELLDRVKRQLAQPADWDKSGLGGKYRESVLLASAARYSSPPSDFAATPPTGFDPDAAALFEAIVESACLVVNADGEFDQAEREVFTLVLLEASNRRVSERQVQAIVSDLATQLAEDGLERRLARLRMAIARPNDRREALRIAALLARVSSGVSDVELSVLRRLAATWDLEPSAVDEALVEVTRSLDG